MESPAVCFLDNMPPFKKLYQYVVMICLAAFQILLLLTIMQLLMGPPRKGTLRFSLPSLDSSSRYSEYALLKRLKHKHITQVNLTGDSTLDEPLLSYVATSIRLMHQNNDTMEVIKVHFSKNCTYGQFVRLVNTMLLQQQRYYTFVEDDFYIFQTN